MNRDNRQWEFSFDLNQENLKKAYGKKHYNNAYQEIQNYLFKNLFDNKAEKQGSCYFTSKNIPSTVAIRIIKKMFRKFPWLSECLNNSALYVRPESVYDFNMYSQRLNRKESHIKDLEDYFDKAGLEMHADLKADLDRRKGALSKKKRSLGSQINSGKVRKENNNQLAEVQVLNLSNIDR